jgi:hypothetical protein
VPNWCGPRSRASAIPIATVPSRAVALLAKLQPTARDARPTRVFLSAREGPLALPLACRGDLLVTFTRPESSMRAKRMQVDRVLECLVSSPHWLDHRQTLEPVPGGPSSLWCTVAVTMSTSHPAAAGAGLIHVSPDFQSPSGGVPGQRSRPRRGTATGGGGC